MRRVRFGLLLALAGAVLTAGCASSPPPPPNPNNVPTPPPTYPVDSSGKQVTSLCDLLNADDFTTIAAITVRAPTKVTDSPNRAQCQYGSDAELTVVVEDTIESAQRTYQNTQQTLPITPVKLMAIGGVDESVYGPIGQTKLSGLGLRRLRLVVVIQLPGQGDDMQPKLIQLAGRVLQRANALGT
jgi:hypothetical protein